MIDSEIVRVVFDRGDAQAQGFELRQQRLDERGLARVALADDGDQRRLSRFAGSRDHTAHMPARPWLEFRPLAARFVVVVHGVDVTEDALDLQRARWRLARSGKNVTMRWRPRLRRCLPWAPGRQGHRSRTAAPDCLPITGTATSTSLKASSSRVSACGEGKGDIDRQGEEGLTNVVEGGRQRREGRSPGVGVGQDLDRGVAQIQSCPTLTETTTRSNLSRRKARLRLSSVRPPMVSSRLSTPTRRAEPPARSTAVRTSALHDQLPSRPFFATHRRRCSLTVVPAA